MTFFLFLTALFFVWLKLVLSLQHQQYNEKLLKIMERTWRWFGKNDKITLAMLRQIGVQGIVTALHDVPNGEVWTRE